MTSSSYRWQALGLSVPAPTPAADSLRVIVRGTGSIGSRHARVAAALGIANVALWPVRERNPLSVRSDLPEAAQWVSDFADAEGALVIIATDTSRHIDDALEALDAGAGAVLLEKPVSPTAEDARRLAAHPRAGVVRVSAPLRFHEAFASAQRAIGHVGRLHWARVVSQSWLPDWRPGRDYRESYSARATEGGVLRDLVHDIDYPLSLFGTPERLSAQLGHGILGIEAEESADMLWFGETAVSLRLDYTTPIKRRGFQAAGDRGEIAWDVVTNTVSIRNYEQQEARERHFPDDADVDVVLARQTLAILQVSGLLEGTSMERFTPATLTEGIAAVAICDAARTSDSSGCRQGLG